MTETSPSSARISSRTLRYVSEGVVSCSQLVQGDCLLHERLCSCSATPVHVTCTRLDKADMSSSKQQRNPELVLVAAQ